MNDILIIGGGIGGLTLGLVLHGKGIPCRIYEQAAAIKPLGVGVNLLPHSTKQLAALGLLDSLAKVAVQTKEATFFNRFGQHIYSEALGRLAGYEHPQFSIHRADLHDILREAFIARAGADRYVLGQRCVKAESDATGAIVHFAPAEGFPQIPPQRGACAIGADGIHSAIRKQLYPDEGDPVYSGVNMWRGVTPWKPFLVAANMTRVGWLNPCKLVIYPIRNNIDEQGRQLINWVVEIETTKHRDKRDWNRPGNIEDFMPVVADWKFDWLDIPALFRASELCLEFPMVDQEPLPQWTFGRVTLLGDAAHPMYPRGSNGAGQAILDCAALGEELERHPNDVPAALAAYEARRRPATTNVVLENRKNPPDAILREVWERTGDKPFKRIEDVITREEMVAITDSYKRVAGYSKEALKSA